MSESTTATAAQKPVQKKSFGFLGAAAIVLCLVAIGHGIGNRLISVYPPWLALKAALVGDWSFARAQFTFDAFGWRGVLTTVFLLACVVYVVVFRAIVARFFRKMHVGVTLVALTTIAITLGVLVPQIDGFEDPSVRVPSVADIDAGVVERYLASPKFKADEYPGIQREDNPILFELPSEQHARLKEYRSQYDPFRWSEGYFVYHLAHPYGIGMPSTPVPENTIAALGRYERVYGKEERKNRETLMRAAFAGGEKTDEIAELVTRWDPWLRRAFDACTFLELNRTYKSNWFATLLTLLATAVAFNTFRGPLSKRFTIHKLGFFVTHMGILTLLAGGLVSNLLTDRGILQLYLGEPAQDSYWQHYRSDKRRQMPFGVKLEHFARKEWKALEIHTLDEQFASKPPRYTLWPGRTIDFDFELNGDEWRPRTRLVVRELYDHARIDQPKVSEGDPKAGDEPFPLVELEIPNLARASNDPVRVLPEGPTRSLYLSPLLPNQGYMDPERAFRLVIAHDEDPLQMFPSDPDRTLGTLFVEIPGSGEAMPTSVPVRIGERVELPGGFEIEVVDATSDLDISKGKAAVAESSGDTRPMAERPDRFCAAWIDIRKDGKPPERRVVHEMIDAVEYGIQDSYPFKEVICELRWDRWSAPGGPRYVLSWGSDGSEPQLVDEQGVRKPVRVGEALDLPGEREVKPLRFFERAQFEKRLHFLPNEVSDDGWNASFYKRDARGLVLDVIHFPDTERELIERVEMASTDTDQANAWISGNRKFGLRFLENTDGFPFDWRSVLTIVERDEQGHEQVVDVGSEREREIRVNDYFKYKGYRFFQTNADPKEPEYSGIGVVYDPGIPIVLAGMYIIIAGTLIAFIVRPIVLGLRGRENNRAYGLSDVGRAAPTSGADVETVKDSRSLGKREPQA